MLLVAHFATYLEFLGPLWFMIASFSCFQGYQSKFRWQSYVTIFPGQLQCCLKARLIPKNLERHVLVSRFGKRILSIASIVHQKEIRHWYLCHSRRGRDSSCNNHKEQGVLSKKSVSCCFHQCTPSFVDIIAIIMTFS